MRSTMDERYRAALALVPERLPGLVRNRAIDPQWTGDGDEFWYRRDGADGHEYVLVDPETFTRRPLFDRDALAERLSAVFGAEVDLRTIPVTAYEPHLVRLGDGRAAAFGPDGDSAVPAAEPALRSPDGKTEVFRREHDLWLRDENGEERQVTRAGEAHFAWGATPDYLRSNLPLAARGRPLPPMATAFSPSGRLLLTGRLDERSMPEHPFVDQLPADRAKPRLDPFRYHHVDEQPDGVPQLAIIDLVTGDQAVFDDEDGLTDGLAMTHLDTVAWSADERFVHLLAHETGGRTAALLRIDTRTGARTVALSETAEPIYEPNTHEYSLPLIRVLPATNEAIWFSQRDGWGHLYLYDLGTGACRHRITSGDLVVRDILRVDERRREVLFLAGTGEDGGNPYWRRLYKASLDGGAQMLLTPEPADHELKAPAIAFFTAIFGGAAGSSISPSGRCFVDHVSTVEKPTEIVLRDTATGAVIGELERADVSALTDAGYVFPQQFQVTADDGKTPLWGLLTLPPDPVDPERIPVIDLMYAGYQVVTQPSGFLSGGGNPSWGRLGAAYAALGFATVVLDGRGTPGRDRVFRQWTREELDTPRGIEDHVTAIRALADRHPGLDLSRVGVTGHSYGGYNSVRAMLSFPEFFTVGVSSAGVHDARKLPRGAWNWHLGNEDANDPGKLAALGNLRPADRLRGKLLLVSGDRDANVSLDHTFALIDALSHARKRFDLKIWPGVDHYGGTTPYVRALMWDYFVEHLLGEEPPAELPC